MGRWGLPPAGTVREALRSLEVSQGHHKATEGQEKTFYTLTHTLGQF